MKTSDEFLEELKRYVDENVFRLDSVRRTEYGDGSLAVYASIQQRIEQFQAEQKNEKSTSQTNL